MCAKMPIVIESVGDQGQRVEQGFEWPDDSALKRVEKEGGRQTSCFVPDFDGAFLSSDSKDALWDRFFMGAPQRLSGCVPRQAFRGRHGV